MMGKRAWFGLATAVLTTLAATAPVSAQDMGSGKRVSLEARGGLNVPTFDIADVASARSATTSSSRGRADGACS
ncbi:MAG: hypothetical protein Q8W51_07400 [Candidatus Palauibacterales bacterium]|nr:hypothetical protein [Candidatus Palauibacterales bacterium]MDP2529547.1 hypothetical protein [Candidatus Palauibacterales bacterium]